MNKVKNTSSAKNRRYVSPAIEVTGVEMKYSCCLVGSSRKAATEELEEEDFIM